MTIDNSTSPSGVTDTLTGPSTDILFTPFKVGSLELPNRIVMAPMTRSMAPEGRHGPDAAAYYRRRAENGVGLIISEGTWIPHAGASYDDMAPKFYGEPALAEWKKILDGVHEAGGKMMPQLWHAGYLYQAQLEGLWEGESTLRPEQCGPSGIAVGMGKSPTAQGAPMSQVDIDSVIEAYGEAAATAYKMGFDGVELHGAHGYLIDQFFWDQTNLRDDRYGGSIEKRSTFASEVIANVRSRTAPDFPIVMRFSQFKQYDFDAKLAQTPQELEIMLRPMVDAGVDMFDCSQRRFWEAEFPGSDLNLAGWTKKVTGIPSISVGSVSLDNELFATFAGEEAASTGITPLLEMLDNGDFDLIAVGRALLANPDWVKIIREGRFDRLKPFTKKYLESLY